jgi:hypothetical protein
VQVAHFMDADPTVYVRAFLTNITPSGRLVHLLKTEDDEDKETAKLTVHANAVRAATNPDAGTTGCRVLWHNDKGCLTHHLHTYELQARLLLANQPLPIRDLAISLMPRLLEEEAKCNRHGDPTATEQCSQNSLLCIVAADKRAAHARLNARRAGNRAQVGRLLHHQSLCMFYRQWA